MGSLVVNEFSSLSILHANAIFYGVTIDVIIAVYEMPLGVKR